MIRYLLNCVLVFFCFSVNASAFTFKQDAVAFDKDEMTSMDHLGERLRIFHERVVKILPDTVRGDIVNGGRNGLFNLPMESGEWLLGNLVPDNDPELIEAFKSVVKWSHIHGDDVMEIVYATFREYLLKEDLQVAAQVEDCMIIWREENSPQIEFSPDGRGEIRWIWKLPCKSRRHGRLHVGMDLKKRTFVCYESDKGLYFPEGETMERIYSEIVQEPKMAGEFVGKGFRNNR